MEHNVKAHRILGEMLVDVRGCLRVGHHEEERHEQTNHHAERASAHEPHGGLANDATDERQHRDMRARREHSRTRDEVGDKEESGHEVSD